MEEKFDVNKVASNFLESEFEKIVKGALTVVKKGSDEISLKLKIKYKKYLEDIAQNYCLSKSFFIREEPIPIKEFYIPLGLSNKNITYNTVVLNKLLISGRHIIVSGSGGAGKSMLMKFLLVNCLEDKYKVPVFVELRDNNDENKHLLQLISDSLMNFGLELEMDYFEKSLKLGHYIIFLDGLDEVKTEYRDVLTKEINSFTKKYNNCDIIVSTRPDDRVSELTIFKSFTMMPLDLDKSLKLIELLPADEEMKKKFLNDLKNGLFEKHKSFLSNPLLLSIMLLTYGYSADIPNRLSIFYNQAYEALYQRHDALKGAYKRDKETTLDILQFEKVLIAFCIQSYDDRKFKFSKIEALEYIEKAKTLSNIEVNSTAYLCDLLQSVCILVEDGMFLNFTHRSFQEYFAAKFIVKSPEKIKTRILKKYIDYSGRDNLFKLIHEMDQEYIESQVWIPMLENFFKEIKFNGVVTKEIHLAFLKKRYAKLLLYKNRKDANEILGTIKTNETNFIIRNILNCSENALNLRKSMYTKSDYSNLINLFNDEKGNDIRIEIDKLKIDDPIFVEINKTTGHFSKNQLLWLNRIYNELKQKYKKLDENLEALLS